MTEERGQPAFGRYLKQTRQRLGLSLRKVESLTDGRIRNAFLSQIENGKVRLPNIDLLMDLSDVYGLDSWELMWQAGYQIPREASERDTPEEVPEEVLLEEATDRLAELHLTETELDEVMDYAAFVKDRGRRALARRRVQSSTTEVEEPQASLRLPVPDDAPPDLDDENSDRTPPQGEAEDARILEYQP